MRTRSFGGETLDGDRTLVTVTAQVPGSTPRSQVVLVAQRDAAESGRPRRPVRHGGADRDARASSRPHRRAPSRSPRSAARAAARPECATSCSGCARPVDAVIEIGDLGRRERATGADRRLVGRRGKRRRCACSGRSRSPCAARPGSRPGSRWRATQLARCALPLSVSGQGVALDAGMPSVRLARGGELPSDPGSRVSAQRLGEYGQAVVRVLERTRRHRSAPAARRPTSRSRRRSSRRGRCGCSPQRCCCRPALTILDGAAARAPARRQAARAPRLGARTGAAVRRRRAAGPRARRCSGPCPISPRRAAAGRGTRSTRRRWTAIGCVLAALALVALRRDAVADAARGREGARTESSGLGAAARGAACWRS